MLIIIQWGAYTNGATLKHADRLKSVKIEKGYNLEDTNAKKVNAIGFSSAYLCPDMNQNNSKNNRCYDNRHRGDQLFRHLGFKRSPGFKELDILIDKLKKKNNK